MFRKNYILSILILGFYFISQNIYADGGAGGKGGTSIFGRGGNGGKGGNDYSRGTSKTTNNNSGYGNGNASSNNLSKHK